MKNGMINYLYLSVWKGNGIKDLLLMWLLLIRLGSRLGQHINDIIPVKLQLVTLIFNKSLTCHTIIKIDQ